jgi:hypothetical protein
MLKEDAQCDYAARLVKEEIEKYKESLAKTGTKYRIIEETPQSDGSVITAGSNLHDHLDAGFWKNIRMP